MPAAQVPVDDRGLAYGDGVFETLAVRDGELLALDRHLRRLAEGCARLGFEAPSREVIEEHLAPAAAGPGRGVVKLIVTRGSGGRGYQPPAHPLPALFVTRHPWPDGIVQMRRDGVHVVALSSCLGDVPALAGIKHLNRLEQVLAAAELARTPHAQEGLVRGSDGRIVSGVMSNLFLVRGGRLRTPCLRRCGVNGIIRGAILEMAAGGLLPAVTVNDVTASDVESAEEVFLTNCVRGVMPVRRIGDRSLGVAGPVTIAARGALERSGLTA